MLRLVWAFGTFQVYYNHMSYRLGVFISILDVFFPFIFAPSTKQPMMTFYLTKHKQLHRLIGNGHAEPLQKFIFIFQWQCIDSLTCYVIKSKLSLFKSKVFPFFVRIRIKVKLERIKLKTFYFKWVYIVSSRPI